MKELKEKEEGYSVSDTLGLFNSAFRFMVNVGSTPEGLEVIMGSNLAHKAARQLYYTIPEYEVSVMDASSLKKHNKIFKKDITSDVILKKGSFSLITYKGGLSTDDMGGEDFLKDKFGVTDQSIVKVSLDAEYHNGGLFGKYSNCFWEFNAAIDLVNLSDDLKVCEEKSLTRLSGQFDAEAYRELHYSMNIGLHEDYKADLICGRDRLIRFYKESERRKVDSMLNMKN